ncbi:hypothetical protein HS125_07470 [bacterium]|nr:hypothetical protein [bacterium]
MADWRGTLPQYGLLIGDAAFDWKDDFGSGVRNYMPIYNPPATIRSPIRPISG